MTLSDIITLAKAGYGPKDVKELIEATKSSDAGQEKPPAAKPAENEKPAETPPAAKPAEKTEPKEAAKPEEMAAKATAQPEDAAELKAKLEDLEAKYEALQNKYNKQDVSGAQASDYNSLLDTIKSYC